MRGHAHVDFQLFSQKSSGLPDKCSLVNVKLKDRFALFRLKLNYVTHFFKQTNLNINKKEILEKTASKRGTEIEENSLDLLFQKTT